jgi:uncharacterized membrane protein
MNNRRFWEIDALRGMAIIMMIVYNYLFTLKYFDVLDVDVHSVFWMVFAYVTASVFILLVGISLTLSYSRAKEHKTKKELLIKYLKRGLKIFGWGLIITASTFVFLKSGFIVFGILHFIGLSIILSYPFLKMGLENLLLGIVFISVGVYVSHFTFDFPWLVWLGFMPRHFYTLDYFPLLPWFGVVLVGLFLGNFLYPDHVRTFNLPDLSGLSFIRFLCFLGRHSLLIYLLHQPVLVALLYFFMV